MDALCLLNGRSWDGNVLTATPCSVLDVSTDPEPALSIQHEGGIVVTDSMLYVVDTSLQECVRDVVECIDTVKVYPAAAVEDSNHTAVFMIDVLSTTTTVMGPRDALVEAFQALHLVRVVVCSEPYAAAPEPLPTTRSQASSPATSPPRRVLDIPTRGTGSTSPSPQGSPSMVLPNLSVSINNSAGTIASSSMAFYSNVTETARLGMEEAERRSGIAQLAASMRTDILHTMMAKERALFRKQCDDELRDVKALHVGRYFAPGSSAAGYHIVAMAQQDGDAQNGAGSNRRRGGSVPKPTATIKPLGDAAKSILEDVERHVRVATDCYYMTSCDVQHMREKLEREVMLRGSTTDEDVARLEKALEVERERSERLEVVAKRAEENEAVAIERARKREAELHNQIEQLTGGGVRTSPEPNGITSPNPHAPASASVRSTATGGVSTSRGRQHSASVASRFAKF